jgi:DNA-binding MarR family transcriptional regulator
MLLYIVGMREDTRDNEPLPALIRAARGAFAQSIREQLFEADIHDLPRNGTFIVGGLNRGAPAGELFRDSGLREGARSRLLEALLERGFVQAGSGEAKFGLDDLELTEKGQRAAEASARGVRAVTEELTSNLSAEEFSGFRAGLLALIEIRERADEHHAFEHEHGHGHTHNNGHSHDHEPDS